MHSSSIPPKKPHADERRRSFLAFPKFCSSPFTLLPSSLPRRGDKASPTKISLLITGNQRRFKNAISLTSFRFAPLDPASPEHDAFGNRFFIVSFLCSFVAMNLLFSDPEPPRFSTTKKTTAEAMASGIPTPPLPPPLAEISVHKR
jgi:hypothetical protein